VKSSPPGGGGGEADGGGLSASAPTGALRASPPPEGEDLATLAETAARLCKADLVTGMVGEFPELQGIIGGHLARAQGLPDAVADAIRDHYKPVGAGDDVPTAPVTVAVSLADKLDTIVSFLAAGMSPSGSKDPFAVRRAAIAAIRLILTNSLRLDLAAASRYAFVRLEKQFFELNRFGFDDYKHFSALPTWKDIELGNLLFVFRRGEIRYLKRESEVWTNLTVSFESEETKFRRLGVTEVLLDFFADRLKVQQREAGVRHDLIDAVFALGGEDDLVRLLARVKALQAFVGTTEGADLLAGYKRAANILKKEGVSPFPSRGEGNASEASEGEGTLDPVSSPLPGAHAPVPLPFREREEEVLTTALDAAEPRAAAAIDSEDFAAAMTALSTLRTPIDAFFENVTVNDPDPAKRAARLALLSRFRDAVHRVADFSKIEG
jgi:glycyl-tRNA synthetase beta chain